MAKETETKVVEEPKVEEVKEPVKAKETAPNKATKSDKVEDEIRFRKLKAINEMPDGILAKKLAYRLMSRR